MKVRPEILSISAKTRVVGLHLGNSGSLTSNGRLVHLPMERLIPGIELEYHALSSSHVHSDARDFYLKS